MMRSVGTKGVTALTIITLVFAPVLGKQRRERLVGRSVVRTTVRCKPKAQCPRHRTLVKRIYLSAPDAGEAAAVVATH
ncbi:MAG: hypothetical protein ABSG43_01825 [Solirubrobacteraceae bacterium]|jgi:hypothetical protein